MSAPLEDAAHAHEEGAGHEHDHHPHAHATPVAEPVRGIGSRFWLDRFGFTVSFLCAIHCAAMPIVLGAFPSLGATLFGDTRVEWFLFGAVVAIGTGSLLPSYLRRHRDPRPLMLFGVGVSLLLASKFAFEEGSTVEAVASAVAATFVASGHLFNARLVRRCSFVCHEAHDHIH